jgi:hypothetical protein
MMCFKIVKNKPVLIIAILKKLIKIVRLSYSTKQVKIDWFIEIANE